MNGREGHEAGEEGEGHGLVLVVLCVGFAVSDRKDYTYVFGGLGYEGVGGEKRKKENTTIIGLKNCVCI